jgi:AcrR family transcriptional regulator
MASPAAIPAPARDDIRARILAQSRLHLFNSGYRAFTMDHLAAELGISKKTLYVHFRSKDAIIRSVINDFAAGVRAEAEALIARPRLTFAEKLRGFAESMMARLEHVRPAVMRDLQRTAPHLHRYLQQVRSENIGYTFGRFLEEGQLTGAVRDDLSPVFAGEFYVHAMQGLMSPETQQRLRLSPAETFERALRIFFGGLLTPSGQKEYEKLFPR